MLKTLRLQGSNQIEFHWWNRRTDYAIFAISFSSHFSFFPRIVQPVITILVNPIHLCFLRLNVISSNPVELLPVTTNSVMISSFDPQNIERRRQIALKALSERLSKSNESNRQQLFQKQQQQQQQKMHTNLPSTSSAATTLVEIEQNSTAEQSQSKQFAGV